MSPASQLDAIRRIYPRWKPNSVRNPDGQINAFYHSLLARGAFNNLTIKGQIKLPDISKPKKDKQLSIFDDPRVILSTPIKQSYM